jgi:hydroxymethylpyrimidine/phosphomethylpyrimidine kinase
VLYSGLEADQKVIAAHGCYAMTATTALTAQNTMGVVDIHYTPPAFVRKLIDACISDVGVDVVKTGIILYWVHYTILFKAIF